MGIFDKIFGNDTNTEEVENNQSNQNENNQDENNYDDVFNELLNDDNQTKEKDIKKDSETPKEEDVEPTDENEKTEDNNQDNNKQTQLGSLTVDIDGIPVTFEENELKEILANSIKAKQKVESLDIYANIAEDLKNNNIAPEDVVAIKDALTGNKEALKYILSKFNDEDIEEILDNENINYEPKVDYNTNDFDIKKEFERILATNEGLAYKIKTNIDIMPNDWKLELNNKDIFNAFKEDVEKGVFNIVYPNAYKEYIKNPNLSLTEAYSIAYEKLSKNYQEPKKKEPTDTSYSKSSKTNKNTYDEIFEQLTK